MTDRYHSLLVTLEHDMRTDDAEMLIDAIKALRGVIDVRGNVTDPVSMAAQARARYELLNTITRALAIPEPRDSDWS